MCGIFGIVTAKPVQNIQNYKKAVKKLFSLSVSRGKEASGLMIRNNQGLLVYKEEIAADKMVKTSAYNRFFDDALKNDNASNPLAFIGHTRMVTNGRRGESENNQPVIVNNFAAVHNGIITNVDDAYKNNPKWEREFCIDSEILLRGISFFENSEKDDFVSAFSKTIEQLEGTVSTAIIDNAKDMIFLASNNGSCYYWIDNKKSPTQFIFSSEKSILEDFCKSSEGADIIQHSENQDIDTIHISPGKYVMFPRDLSSFEAGNYVTRSENKSERETKINNSLTIIDYSKHYIKRRENLRYCTKCVLPETMPFIEFDKDGICNYCNSYQPITTKGPEKLEEYVQKYRRNDGKPDCLMMFSGGRDSSYGLHYAKEVLGLNPIAYTYDWGLITDLGRRNQARMCGELGVEHILISADIPKKRANVRKNVLAWLKKPDLGMVPLFMAGDKTFLSLPQMLRKKTGIDLVLACDCPLEMTRFKSGFCGVQEFKKRAYDIPLTRKFKLLSYYAKQFIKNPAYINSTLWDSFKGFAASYATKHDYLFMFDYLEWSEEVIDETLQSPKYNWELEDGYDCSWRIGDGTVGFYNYIYHTIAGLTENNTLRSNQIRQGQLTREKAMELIEIENQPRWNLLQWYAQVIGFNLDEALNIINRVPKLY